MLERVAGRSCDAAGNFILESGTASQIEVAEYSGIRSRVWIALIVEAEAKVKVRLRRAFQVSSANIPQVLEAAFHDHNCCWPVMGLYITLPSFRGASCARVRRLSKLNWDATTGPGRARRHHQTNLHIQL